MKRVTLLIVLVAILTATACGGIPGLSAPATPTLTATPVPPTSTPTMVPTATLAPTSTATAAPTATLASPADVLAKAFKGMAGVKTFRATMTSTGVPTVGTTESTIEVVLPDRFHMISKQMEFILIGKTFYMKTGAKWAKVTMPKGIDLSVADPTKLDAAIAASTEKKLVGTDDINGTLAYVYQYTTTIKGPPAQKYTTKVWISAKDGLPLKTETTLKPGQVTTVVFSDYNSNIVINAPI